MAEEEVVEVVEAVEAEEAKSNGDTAGDTAGDQSLELTELNTDLDEEEPPEEDKASATPAPSSVPVTEEMGSPQSLEAVYDIPVKVSAVLGKSTMQVNEILKLGRGAVVELDRKVGEAIDIYVNNRLVARGEIVVIEDRLGITMTEIIKTERG
ncbi:MAG: flagellar motor switch protein FliN [Rhodospirillales bacterium]